ILSTGNTIAAVETFDSAHLIGIDALFLVQPYAQDGDSPAFSDSEIAAITSFVSRGGGLVVQGEAGSGADALVLNLNALVAPFGTAYAAGASESSGETITGFVDHSVTAYLGAIGVDYQRRLALVLPPAMSLTTGFFPQDDSLAVVDGGDASGNVVLL